MKNYKKLQNGSDIRGIALTGVPGELPNLTVDEARDIARGFLVWLCKKTGKDVKDIKAVPMVCTVDGIEYKGNYVFGSISNSYTVGKIIHMSEDTVCLNDGKFEVLLVRMPKDAKGWTNVVECILKKKFDCPEVDFVQGSHIEIKTLDGSKIPWTLDGEFGGDVSEVVADVKKHAFRMFRPPLLQEMDE